jgi:DNA primase
MDMARDAIKQARQVVIVEGYVDAIIAHQYGTKQTVACIGSAITEKHIQQLKKLTRQVTLALDPDAAGSAATEHGIEEALKGFDRTLVPVPLAAGKTERQKGYGQSKQSQPRGMIRLEEQVDAEINVLQLPAGEDPDEYIRRDFSAWFYDLSHPKPLIDYYFSVKTVDLNLKEPTGKTEAARRLLPVIGMISDRIKRDAYLRKLAAMISIDERSLHEELQRVLRGQKTVGVAAEFTAPLERGPGAGRGFGKTAQTSAAAQGKGIGLVREGEAFTTSDRQMVGLDRSRNNKLQWEDYLIGLLLLNPGLSDPVCGIINDGDFTGTDTRELYRLLNSVYQRDSTPSLQPFEQFVPPVLLAAVDRAQKCVESGSPKDGAGLIKEAVQCATRLKRARLLQLNIELKYLMNEAEDSGDRVRMRQLQQQVQDIRKQLHTINSATHLHG